MANNWPIHKACSTVPEMSAEDYAALVADINQRGLLEPIELLGGKVIDGRHRLKACRQLGIDPETVDVEIPDCTPQQYVWSKNAARRHLTASQRAALALAFVDENNAPPKGRGNVSSTSGGGEPGRVSDVAGELAGVSGRYVRDALKVQETAPKLVEEVAAGAKTLAQAKREAAALAPKRKPPKPPATMDDWNEGIDAAVEALAEAMAALKQIDEDVPHLTEQDHHRMRREISEVQKTVKAARGAAACRFCNGPPKGCSDCLKTGFVTAAVERVQKGKLFK